MYYFSLNFHGSFESGVTLIFLFTSLGGYMHWLCLLPAVGFVASRQGCSTKLAVAEEARREVERQASKVGPNVKLVVLVQASSDPKERQRRPRSLEEVELR